MSDMCGPQEGRCHSPCIRGLIFTSLPSTWRQYEPLTHGEVWNKLHVVTSQNVVVSMATAVITYHLNVIQLTAPPPGDSSADAGRLSEQGCFCSPSYTAHNRPECVRAGTVP